MSRRHLATAAGAVGLLIAGCGGSSGPSLSAFKTGFATQKTSFRALGNDVGAAIVSAPKKSNAELATEFSALSSRATAQASALRTLKPPAKYKSQLDTLAGDFDTAAADLKAISAAATSGDVSSARSESAKLVQDSATLKSVDQSLSSALGIPNT